MALLDAAYILAAVRRLLAEYSSVKFTDDHLNKWVQEAAMDISLKTLGYEVKDSITTAANTLEQNEPSGCVKLHSCVYNPTVTVTGTLWGDNSADDYNGKMADCLIYKAMPDTPMESSGSGEYLGMGCGAIAPNVNRSLIKFNIKSDLEALGVTTITAATLYGMILWTVAGAHTISAYRVLQNWVESEVTWNSFSSGNLWNTAGCGAASDAGVEDGVHDRFATAEDTLALANGAAAGSYDFILDITSLAQEWLDGTASEYGILLQSDNEAAGNYVGVYESEDVDTKRPYLDVDYSLISGSGAYKGLSRVHPRLIQHVAHNETGAPIHYYHHHNKIGIWPLPDDTYTVDTYCSNVTEDITALPSELRLLAIPYCLAMARLTEGWKDDFEMFITMYLNSLMPHRADRGQYKLNDVDARDKFWIPQGKIVNG